MKAYLKPVPKPCAKKIYEQIDHYLYRINKKKEIMKSASSFE